MISNEMMSNFYMLCPRVLNWIFGKVDGTSVITPNRDLVLPNAKILKLLLDPQHLSTATPSSYISASAVDNATEFCFLLYHETKFSLRNW